MFTFHTGDGHPSFSVLKAEASRTCGRVESVAAAPTRRAGAARCSSSSLGARVRSEAAAVEVHRTPETQQPNCISSEELFPLLEQAISFLLLLLSRDVFCFSFFFFLAECCFSPVIRMPASSTASFRPFTAEAEEPGSLWGRLGRPPHAGANM